MHNKLSCVYRTAAVCVFDLNVVWLNVLIVSHIISIGLDLTPRSG